MNTEGYSLSRRLTLSLLVVVLTVLALLSTIGAMLFDNSLRAIMANDLRNDADSVLHSLVRSSEGIRPDLAELDAAYQRPFSGRYYQVAINSGTQIRHWRSRSLWDVGLEFSHESGLNRTLAAGPMGQKLLVWRGDFQRFGATIVIVTARDYTPVLDTFRQLAQWLALLIVLALGLLVFFQQRVVDRSLKPLAIIARQIADIHAGERDKLDSLAPQELSLLQDEINRLLAYTHKVVTQNRHAVGDLGHSLKTPLSVLASLTEDSGLRDNPVLRTKLLAQIDDIRERIERILNRARLNQTVLPGDFFVPSEDIPALIQSLGQIHGPAIEFQWTCNHQRPIALNRHDILEILGNLLDNGCKWALRSVALDIRVVTDMVEFTVEDDGPGIDTTDHESILERGYRLNDAKEGHGLGLGIVRDIVAHHGGALELGRSECGGLRVRISLPLR